MRVVVIGGDAAGMSAASQLKRLLRDEVAITVLEQQEWTSYSACGIPYWVAGYTDGPDELIARSPEKHRDNGLDVRTGVVATAIDTSGRRVTARGVRGGPDEEFGYDHLIVATGSSPASPPIDGLELPGVHRVQTLDQGQAAIDSLARAPQRAVVLGAGYVGLEMAEAARSRGLQTTILDLSPEPMSTMDPDMGRRIRAGLTERGVLVHTSEPARSILPGADGRVAAVATDHGQHQADIVFLGLGVTPRSGLAASEGLPIGEFGGILTDPRQQVLGFPGVWAGGDCTEVVDRITGHRRYVPLGTHANKHGRVIGLNIAGHDAAFPGVVDTAITKFQDIEIARTGLREAEGPEFGMDLVAVTIESRTRAGYMPGAAPIWVKMLAERDSGLLRGVQIVGGPGSGKRIDVAAVALATGLTVADVVNLDLAYAPPFSPVWDPVQVAARALLPKLA